MIAEQSTYQPQERRHCASSTVSSRGSNIDRSSLLQQGHLEALAEGDLKVLARLSKELGEGYKAMGLGIVQSDESFSFGLQAIKAQAARMQGD